jgi:hypothetical protein
MAILTPSQLQASNNATYTTNGVGSITGATANAFNVDFISSSITVSQTSSLSVASAQTATSASYAATASVLLGSVVSASYALSSSYALNATTANSATTASNLIMNTTSVDQGYFLVLVENQTGVQAPVSDAGIAYNPSTNRLGGINARFSTKIEASGSLQISGSAYGNVVPVAVASNTASIDLASGNFFTATLGSNATTFFNVTNPLPGVTANLILTTGTNSTASFSSNVKQPSGNSYLPTSGSGQIDALSLIAVDASNVYLVASKKFV